MLDHGQIVDAVIRDYIGVLNRLPDPTGLNFWTSKVEAGEITLEGVTNAFADQIGANPFYGPGVTSSTIVDWGLASSMYFRCLNRIQDQDGINFWAHSGVTVGQLFNILLNTPEFIKGTEYTVSHWTQMTSIYGTEPGSILWAVPTIYPEYFFA